MFRRVATAEAPGIIARRLAHSENTMNPAVASLVILDTPFFAVAWKGSRAKRCSRPRQICDRWCAPSSPALLAVVTKRQFFSPFKSGGNLTANPSSISWGCCRDFGWNLFSSAISSMARLPDHAARSIAGSDGFSLRLCQPSTLRIVICPEASRAQNNVAAVSADGRTV
jgi:hypothetical protein